MLGLLTVTLLALAQDPYVTAPKNYKLELENQYVRVSRVTYFPGDKLPVHSHPSLPTVYIYLTDGGAVRYTHITPSFMVERPVVKAGSVRFNRNAQVETHEVEYLGDTRCEYLRVELKTKPAPPHRDARLKADADFPWEDAQVRISRTQAKAPNPENHALFVNLLDRNFVWNEVPEKEGQWIVVELK